MTEQQEQPKPRQAERTTESNIPESKCGCVLGAGLFTDQTPCHTAVQRVMQVYWRTGHHRRGDRDLSGPGRCRDQRAGGPGGGRWGGGKC